MSYHRLRPFIVSVTGWLQRVNDPPHLLLLLGRQLDIPRRKVLLQTLRLGRAWNRNHTLRHNPCQSDLGQSAALALGQLLDLLDDLLVVVEVLSLEFGDCGVC